MGLYGPFKEGNLAGESLHSLWNKRLYIWFRRWYQNLKIDESLGKTVIEGPGGTALGEVYEIEKDWENAEFSLPIGSGGGASSPTSYAFQISAVHETTGDPPVLTDPPTYTVTVLGGSAQVLGGAEVVFGDHVEYGVADGTFIYIRFVMWDESGDAVSAWDDGFQFAAVVPTEALAPKSLVFAIGRVGANYVGNVNQFRVGSIQAVALVNASPSADDINELEI